MAAKKPNPAMEFILQSLKQNKKASYKDIAAAAGKKRLKVYPIMFGRAQAMLGIVKQAKRGQGKAAKAKAKASKAKTRKRGPGRPRKHAAPAFGGTLDGIIAAVKHNEQSKARYRKALERIETIVADVLGS